MSEKGITEEFPPNRSEMVMYGTGGDFRHTAIYLYSRRLLVSEVTAEKAIRAEMEKLGMHPDPGIWSEPAYAEALKA